MAAPQAVSRGDINVATLVCIPCQKKHGGVATCYAHNMVDGKPMCIFCEDSEPCMHEQRTKRIAATVRPVISKSVQRSHPAPKGRSAEPAGPVPAPSVPPEPQTDYSKPHVGLVRKLRADGLSDPDVVSALRNLGYKSRDAHAAIEIIDRDNPQKELPVNSPAQPIKTNGHALGAQAAPRLCKCNCGGIVPKDFRFSYLKGHKPHRSTPGATALKKAKPGERACSEGCGRKLRKDNKSGVCTPCITGKSRAKIRGKIARPHVEPTAAIASPALLDLRVNETQLDRFLTLVDWNAVVPKLPAEMKVALANHYFSAGLDQVGERAEATAA